MHYPAELDFLLRVLKKMHIAARVASPEELPDLPADFGLRQLLGLSPDAGGQFRRWLPETRGNTIYKLSDEFRCRYIFLHLPHSPNALLLGPYTLQEFSRDELMERAEHFGLPASRFDRLKDCFARIPTISDETGLLYMLSALGESLWGSGEAFEIVGVEPAPLLLPSGLAAAGEGDERADVLLKMRLLEERYACENELMDMVSQGRHHRAELMLAGFSASAMEQRSPDRLRNTKNYAIICNTLLRKAAERGGVHPIHLDSLSSHFARQIESLLAAEKAPALMTEMLRAYCRLVRKHSGEQYSPPVQRVIACVETDLAANLSLHSLAEAQNLSAGYLSALFRKETGKTLTEYVRSRRIENGARLLQSSSLQVQTIAQYCGIPDVNYFSKLFKKYKGVTPKQYRARQSGRAHWESGGG